MNRDLKNLGDEAYDLAVVGAGIYGACIARDAALRGLRVALIDKGDFGGATSHNSLKLIHGGFRYIQHADLPRIRQSIRERRAWLSIAPHLVRPLEFVIPTYGHGLRGPEALGLAIALYEAIRGRQDRDLPAEQAVPRGRAISRAECLERIPGLPDRGLSGGATWYDGQMLDADGVLMECLADAAGAGARVANYVAAEGFLGTEVRIGGIRARDALSGDALDIRAAMCVNAAGPWVRALLRGVAGVSDRIPLSGLTRGLNLVTRQIVPGHAVGVSSAAPRSKVGGSGRFYFMTPWFDRTIIGTTHMPFEGAPDDYRHEEQEVEALLEELAGAYPSAGLGRADVTYCYGGLTPAESVAGLSGVRRARRSGIVDHAEADRVEGLISVAGIKYTTARLVAESVVDLVFRKLGRRPPPCRTAETPLPGARGFGSRAELEQAARRDLARVPGAPEPQGDDLRALVTRYGARTGAVLEDAAGTAGQGGEGVEGSWDEDGIFRLRALYGMRHEMVVHLSDLVLRRLHTAARGRLSPARIRWAAEALARDRGWSAAHKAREIEDLLETLERHDPGLRARFAAEGGSGDQPASTPAAQRAAGQRAAGRT